MIKKNSFQSPEFCMLAKKSLFPFTGMFVVKEKTDFGYCRIVGRVDRANILKDFQWIWDLQKNLKEQIQLFEGESSRELLRTIWDWFREEDFPQEEAVSMSCLIQTEEELFLSGVGVSAFWGNTEEDPNTWYPLLPLEHHFYQDRLLDEYPAYLDFDVKDVIPKQILVIPKPFDRHISVQEAIEERLFEVKWS